MVTTLSRADLKGIASFGQCPALAPKGYFETGNND